MKKLKDIPVPTLITGMVGVVWLGSFALRSINPDFTGGPAADALMATTVAWYAKSRKTKNGGQDDLISELLTKNVLPIVSHTPGVADAGPPAGTYQPYPKSAPYQPPPVPQNQPYSPPASKPKQGGLPWSG